MITIKRFIGWLKSILVRLFSKREIEVTNQIPSVIAPEVTPDKPVKFTHNMPKRQPCPFGHGWKKRLEKTLGGALYWCNKCQTSFLVKRA